MSEFQFEFRPLDGVARGIDLFDTILWSVQSDLKQVSLAVLDLEKAFDSISHEAIFEAFNRLEVPDGLRAYLHFLYTHSKTQLSFKNSKSSFFHPVKGVRQGDPLFPLLFLMVFNTVIDQLPTDLRFRLKEALLNHLAYADDLVILAETAEELQQLILVLSKSGESWAKNKFGKIFYVILE